MTTSAPSRPVVFYDGQCPVCSREIALYQRLDKKEAVEWRDLHAPGALEGTGLTWNQAMQRFHCLDAEGIMRSGVDAFSVVWLYLPYWRWASRAVRGLGLVKPLEPLYDWYARRRYRRSCSVEGGGCG
ncbi:MAG: thiol-disulfide oxidoreductase DCC family protein [Halorhodospira sp.]